MQREVEGVGWWDGGAGEGREGIGVEEGGVGDGGGGG